MVGGIIDYKYLLALNSHPKIGSQTLKKILAVFPDPAIFWKEKTFDGSKIDPKITQLIREVVAEFSPEEAVDSLIRNDIGYMTMYDDKYPKLLKELPDAPIILYIQGSLDALKLPSISIVGSRKYTRYGQNIARNIAKECVENGLAVISGLALGIDTEVHRTAVENEGITVGVLGCGLDKVYPTSNTYLAREIIGKNGAIISEYPPGTIPMKQNFPARNRIIAGLSTGVVVVEAAIDSGALITAYQALEYNREVFAVPGNIDSPNSAGTNKLIQEGAKLVTSSEDIFAELNIKAQKYKTKARQQIAETKEENLIYEILRKSVELSGDEIIKETGLNVISVNSVLTILEMKGIIYNAGGGRYRLKK